MICHKFIFRRPFKNSIYLPETFVIFISIPETFSFLFFSLIFKTYIEILNVREIKDELSLYPFIPLHVSDYKCMINTFLISLAASPLACRGFAQRGKISKSNFKI